MEHIILERRKFGQWEVKISNKGHITIVGNWYSNYGLIYPHYIRRFKAKQKEQIIGMDNSYGLTLAVLRWIHGKVLIGRFDHLIETDTHYGD